MVFDGGRARVSIGYRLGMAGFALLVTLLVFALLGGLASAQQDKDGKKDERKMRVEKRETRNAETPAVRLAEQNPTAREALQEVAQAEATQDLDGEPVDEFGNPIDELEIDVNNCDVDSGDSITFQVNGDPEVPPVEFATVINGVNAHIDVSNDGDTITVEDIDNPGDPIEFFVEHEDGTFDTQVLDEGDELEVDTSTINCGNNNNNNNRRDRFPPGFFDDNPFIDDLLDAENDLDDQITDAEASISDFEDDLADSEATTGDGDGGAFAQSGDPDEQPPVTGQRGDVVDEVPTEGPLPNTGGAPLVYVLPALGVFILGLAIVTRRFR